MAGDVCNEQCGAPASSIHIVVEITAKLHRWQVSATNRQAVENGFPFRQETLLKGACFRHLHLEALQVALVILTPPAQFETAFDKRAQDVAVEWLLDEIERRTSER